MSNEKPAAARYGVLMFGCFVGAILLFVLNALPGFFAFIIGALLLFFGYGILSSAKTNDKLAGFVLIIAGLLTVLSVLPFIKHLASWLLKAGAIALLVVWVWNAIRFMLSLRRG